MESLANTLTGYNSGSNKDIPVWYDPHRLFKVRLDELCDALGLDSQDVILGNLRCSHKAHLSMGGLDPRNSWLSAAGMREFCAMNGKKEEFDGLIGKIGYPETDPFHVVDNEIRDLIPDAPRAKEYADPRSRSIYKIMVGVQPQELQRACNYFPGLKRIVSDMNDALQANARSEPAKSKGSTI